MGADSSLRRLRHLDEAACWERLAAVATCRLAYVADGRPRIVPVNHVLDDGKLYLRTMRGTRLSQVLQGAAMPVALEVDGLDPDSRLGWSVVVDGHLVPVLDQVHAARVSRNAPNAWVADAADAYWARLDVEAISGRELVP